MGIKIDEDSEIGKYLLEITKDHQEWSELKNYTINYSDDFTLKTIFYDINNHLFVAISKGAYMNPKYCVAFYAKGEKT